MGLNYVSLYCGADARMRQTSAPYLVLMLENASYQFVTHIAAVAGAVSRNIDVGRGTIDYTTGISRADNLTGIARCINIGVGHAAIGDMCGSVNIPMIPPTLAPLAEPLALLLIVALFT